MGKKFAATSVLCCQLKRKISQKNVSATKYNSPTIDKVKLTRNFR